MSRAHKRKRGGSDRRPTKKRKMNTQYSTRMPKEWKYFDSIANVGATGHQIVLPFKVTGTFSTALNTPNQGTDFYNRIGNRIMMRSLQIFGKIERTGSNATAVGEDLGRILVVYDRQSNGALPVLSDVILSVDSSGGGLSTAESFINQYNRDRFTVLSDETVYLPPCGINGAVDILPTSYVIPNNHPGKTGGFLYQKFIKLKDLETKFNPGGAGTIADVNTGGLFVLVLSDVASTAGTTVAWQLRIGTRLKFHDY